MGGVVEGDTAHIHGEHRFVGLYDVHVPFHDERALDVALQVIRWHQPSVIVLGGDFWDFYSVSAYDRNPARRWNLQEEIDAGEPVLEQIQDAAPRSAVWFIPGNHEDRLRRWLWRHPDVAGLRSLELSNLLPISKFDVRMAKEIAFNSHILFTHGSTARKNAGNSVRAEIEKRRYGWSMVSGHVHRAGVFSTWTRHGLVWGVESGCLCQLDVEYGSALDWSHGLVVGYSNGEGSAAMPVHISSDYRAILPGGETFEWVAN